MVQCETCGNEYDKAFVVTLAERSHTFDSFECAIHTSYLGTFVCSLSLQDRRTQCRSQRRNVLLRPLRTCEWRRRRTRPRLSDSIHRLDPFVHHGFGERSIVFRCNSITCFKQSDSLRMRTYAWRRSAGETRCDDRQTPLYGPRPSWLEGSY